MKRKALFFDIDGTLLVDASKELPKSAAIALTEARRAGHLIFINSGRTRCLIPSTARQTVKAVFNSDSTGLMKIAKEMNEDVFAKNPLCYGGAINQGRKNLDVEIGRVKKKMEEGAEFFLTQPVFAEEDAARLRRIKEETGAKILCGIMPLISRKNAMFMKNEIAGVNVTDEIVARYPEKANRKEGEAAGIRLAKEVMKMVEDFADGYYFSFPFNRVYMLQEIMGK